MCSLHRICHFQPLWNPFYEASRCFTQSSLILQLAHCLTGLLSQQFSGSVSWREDAHFLPWSLKLYSQDVIQCNRTRPEGQGPFVQPVFRNPVWYIKAPALVWPQPVFLALLEESKMSTTKMGWWAAGTGESTCVTSSLSPPILLEWAENHNQWRHFRIWHRMWLLTKSFFS